jgi:hypothetical protein
MGKSKKKESKKSSKEKRSKKKPNDDDVLESILSQGLLEHPQFNSELPNLISALDNGKEVVIPSEGGDDTSPRFLASLFEALPLQPLPGNRWSRDSSCSSLSKHILTRLLKCGAIIQPSYLNQHQIMSTKAMKIVMPLFVAYPALRTEMQPLLDNFLEGEGISLGGIDNPEIKSGLVSFFIALGAEGLTDDPIEFCDEFGCPSSSSGGKHTRRAVETVLSTLRAVGLTAGGDQSDEGGSSSSSSGESQEQLQQQQQDGGRGEQADCASQR